MPRLVEPDHSHLDLVIASPVAARVALGFFECPQSAQVAHRLRACEQAAAEVNGVLCNEREKPLDCPQASTGAPQALHTCKRLPVEIWTQTAGGPRSCRISG
jgi:hypothetical protein